MASKALEVNLARSRIDVTVDQRYKILQEVMGENYGLREGLQVFLEEICHPYKNWKFIVDEARTYALNYFYDFKTHPKWPEAARLYVDIFFQAIDSSRENEVRSNAADNLLCFIHKIINDKSEVLSIFLPSLDYAFERIRLYPKETFFLFVNSYYQLNKIGECYSKALPTGRRSRAINEILIEYYRYTYSYWLGQSDPLVWFEKESGTVHDDRELAKLFSPISHNQLRNYQKELENIARETKGLRKAILDRLIKLPGYRQIVSIYSSVPQKLLAAAGDKGLGNQWKLICSLKIMHIQGLSAIHEETLREINRTLVWLIQRQEPMVIKRSLENTFEILRTSSGKFPGTTLNCVLNMGKGIYKTDNSELVEFFIDSIVSLGFQYPEIRGVSNDWQIQANYAHIENIRSWAQLIGLNPKWSKKLLSSLIINLSLGGVLIKDNDLFPRDITRLLNSSISPVYNLVKQLARLFPSYFNEIGAEGTLRDLSTNIDEICQRKDPLIHFMRKQSHVESSNQIIGLMESILDFWKTRGKEGLRNIVPPTTYEMIETEGPYIDGVHRVIDFVFRGRGYENITDLLNFEEKSIKTMAGNFPDCSATDVNRVEMAIAFYKLLYQKYHLAFTEIDSYLSQLYTSGLPDMEELKIALSRKGSKPKLTKLLMYLEKLKKIILSQEGFEVREDIYRKRHFAVDIPSMYGSYKELKFDALGLSFRLERLVNSLFEEIVGTIDLGLITRRTFSQIYDYLSLFNRALKLDGISSLEMELQLDLLSHSLKIRGFSSTQFLDIFRGFSQAVSNIVNDFFDNIHQKNLLKILAQMPTDRLKTKYLPHEKKGAPEKLAHRVTEIFLRERVASSLGLQQLDLFLSHILKTLYQQSNELPKDTLNLLLSYDPQKVVTPIKSPKKSVSDIIHLSNKGLNIVKIKSFGLPVPPGFIITTEAFRCREIFDQYEPARKNIETQVAKEVANLEKLTGKGFGDPQNPMLLSVRSGSSISLPGMLYTFLNVGINEKVIHGALQRTGNEWFGWDTYRRFLQSYGMAFGLLRDDFDTLIDDFKKRLSIPYKKDFTGRQMKEIAMAYKSLIKSRGIKIEESPLDQLYTAVRKVFDSWGSAKAQSYRKIMGISDDWGTAVTVQKMVYGNLSDQSGAGIFFTHNPRWSGDTLVLWGDFTRGNQGEDVASGLVRTLPLSIKQAEIENREAGSSLEVLFPEIYRALRNWSKALIYEKKWSPQEIEFTFEGPDAKCLYVLQTRNMYMRERKKVYSFDMDQEQNPTLLGHGIGVSGGAMAGRIVFSLAEIQSWRRSEPETPLIMVRNDTVPDDIKEINEADGLLTARGGSTSHASIAAHRLGKTCVVGCANLVCMEKESSCLFNHKIIKSGEWVSMDGLEGSVYLGKMKIKEMERA